MRVDIDQVRSLWLLDHPGGLPEDFERARRPFNAEPGSRHRRVHNQFLEWLSLDHVRKAMQRAARSAHDAESA